MLIGKFIFIIFFSFCHKIFSGSKLTYKNAEGHMARESLGTPALEGLIGFLNSLEVWLAKILIGFQNLWPKNRKFIDYL